MSLHYRRALTQRDDNNNDVIPGDDETEEDWQFSEVCAPKQGPPIHLQSR